MKNQAVQELISANKQKRKLIKQVESGMQTYIGLQKVKAKPFTKGAYVKLTGNNRGLQKADFDTEVGYLIEYPSGKLTWVTKESFDDLFTQTGVAVKETLEEKLNLLLIE